MINSVNVIMIGIIIQSFALFLQSYTIRTPKGEWDSIMKDQGKDLDKEIGKRYNLQTTVLILMGLAIVIQAYGLLLNQFDNWAQLDPIWKEIAEIKQKIGM